MIHRWRGGTLEYLRVVSVAKPIYNVIVILLDSFLSYDYFIRNQPSFMLLSFVVSSAQAPAISRKSE